MAKVALTPVGVPVGASVGFMHAMIAFHVLLS